MRRFNRGNDNRLREALAQQATLGCCAPAIQKLAQVAKLKSHPAGSRLIIQGSDDDRLAFIVSGRVSIFVKQEKVAERGSGQHVGEMSVIDPSARRSATVTALEDTTVAWVDEKDFARVASKHPELWRKLACELASRLRQRGALVRDKNPQPEIFIGSSTESLKIARAIQSALLPDPVTIKPWDKGVFTASEVTIESLEAAARTADFAILILSADDKVRLRGKKVVAPRDNVIFELGMFIGAIGRKRTFMVVERADKLRLPPDLAGVTYLTVRPKKKVLLDKDVAQAVAKIRAAVSKHRVR